MKTLTARHTRGNKRFRNGPGEETPPPGVPEEVGAGKRAALVLHCGGRGISEASGGGGVVLLSENIITQHANLMYLRLTMSFRFGHEQITHLSPFFDEGRTRQRVGFTLLNKMGANRRASRPPRRLRDEDREVVEGAVVIDGFNSLQNVRAFFNRVSAERYQEVFIYVHGHANHPADDRDNGRIVLADAENRRSEIITFGELATRIKAIQADHIGVAIDTCYSGLLSADRELRRRRHLFIALSTNERLRSFGDGENGYHKVREDTFGDWSDLFIFNFQRMGDDDVVDVATERAARAIGSDFLNRSPRRLPPTLRGH